MRVLHRYLGFFLAGIMAVYALSGVIMIFRNTDFLKHEVVLDKQIDPGLSPAAAGKVLGVKNFSVRRTEAAKIYFKNGTYDAATGRATETVMKLPYVIDKMAQLHKSDTKDPLFYLNTFFGAALLFFVVSAFWMFMPGSRILRKGLIFSAAGIVLTLILLFV